MEEIYPPSGNRHTSHINTLACSDNYLHINASKPLILILHYACYTKNIIKNLLVTYENNGETDDSMKANAKVAQYLMLENVSSVKG